MYLVKQHSPSILEDVFSAVCRASSGHCMRVKETNGDYHINLNKSSSHKPSNCQKQIKALIFVGLLNAMCSNSNRSFMRQN